MTDRKQAKLSRPRKSAGSILESPGLRAARAAAAAAKRKPTPEDAPPPSTFASTPASREALRLSRVKPQ